MRNSALVGRLLQGTIWGLAGSGIARALGLIAAVLVARLVGKVGFGQIGVIQTTMSMFGVLAGSGAGLTATRLIAALRITDAQRASRIVTLTMVMSATTSAAAAVGLFASAPWLSRHALAAPELETPLRLSSLLLFFEAMNATQAGILNGFEAFQISARIAIASSLAGLPIAVGGAYSLGVTGYIGALTAARGVNALLNHLAVRQHAAGLNMRLSLAGMRRELRVLTEFSLPSMASGVAIISAAWVCNAILVNSPGGYAEMGVFTAAGNWRSIIFFLPYTVSGIYLPVAANLWAERNTGDFKRVIYANLAINTLASATIAVPVAVLAGPIMRTYGEGFEYGAPTLVLLAASCIVVAVDYATANILISQGRMWLLLAYNLLMAAVLIGSAWWFVSHGAGAAGMAASVLLAYALKVLVQGRHFKTLRHVPPAIHTAHPD